MLRHEFPVQRIKTFFMENELAERIKLISDKEWRLGCFDAG
jgi:hypothetical protein